MKFEEKLLLGLGIFILIIILALIINNKLSQQEREIEICSNNNATYFTAEGVTFCGDIEQIKEILNTFKQELKQ